MNLALQGLMAKRTRDGRVPTSWTANTDHTFGTGGLSLIFKLKYGSDGYWVLCGRKTDDDVTATAGVNYISGAPSGTFNDVDLNATMTTARFVDYDGSNWFVAGYSNEVRYKATPPSGTWSSATNSTNNKYGGAYGNGYYVLASQNATQGAVYTTSLTGSWSTITIGINKRTSNDIYYGSDGYWVLAQEYNRIFYASSTPISFTFKATPFDLSDGVKSVYYNGTYWICTSSAGDIAYTTDPTSAWTLVSNPGPFTDSDSIFNVRYGNGVWVICGSAGKLATATDPTSAGNWTSQTSGFGTSSVTALGYGNGYWVIGGYDGKLAYSQVDIT